MYITLIPAYGRDYTSGKAVQADWDAGKNFQIADFGHPDYGRYMNKADAKSGMTLNIRFKRNMNIKVIKIK